MENKPDIIYYLSDSHLQTFINGTPEFLWVESPFGNMMTNNKESAIKFKKIEDAYVVLARLLPKIPRIRVVSYLKGIFDGIEKSPRKKRNKNQNNNLNPPV